MAGEEGGVETCWAIELALRIACLRQSVRVERHEVARLGGEALFRILHVGAHAESWTQRGQLAQAVGTDENDGVVAAAGDRDRSVVRIVDRQRHGQEIREALALEVACEPVVDFREDRAGTLLRGDGGVDERARHGHDERRREPLAHDVGANDAQAPVREVEVVVVVAAHLAEELDR